MSTNFVASFIYVYSKFVVLSAMNVDLDAESSLHKRRKINREVLCNMRIQKLLLLQFSGLEAAQSFLLSL